MKVLVTGGAGFIGSHIVDALVARGDQVTVLDDFTTGYREHVNPAAEVIEGSVADEDAVRRAVRGCEIVFHQAAHKAVLRSVEQPLPTDIANVHGTLTVLKAACDQGTRRVLYASSSSIYGGGTELPTTESAPLVPRSPYAVTKLTGEHYCRVFSELYGLETLALRYFNVYGPRQPPNATYAAVIPLFIEALMHGTPPVVHGDGRQSRDFTYVDDVVTANLLAASAPAARCHGQPYNIAAGATYSLLDLLGVLGKILDLSPRPIFGPPRPGDVRVSQADATIAARAISGSGARSNSRPAYAPLFSGSAAAPWQPRRDLRVATRGNRAHWSRRACANGALTGLVLVGAGFQVPQRVERVLRRLHRIAVRLLQLGEDLFTMDIDRARRLDAEPYLIAADFENRHHDLVPDHDALVRTSREHEHGSLPSMAAAVSAPKRRAYAVG